LSRTFDPNRRPFRPALAGGAIAIMVVVALISARARFQAPTHLDTTAATKDSTAATEELVQSTPTTLVQSQYVAATDREAKP
jgi:hypothetical protein